MGFAEAVGTLNRLKRARRIRDYAVFGAVASAAYMEPIPTLDLESAADHLRVATLVAVGQLDHVSLRSLLRKFDDEDETLTNRLESIQRLGQ